MAEGLLSNRRILVVEDDYLIADAMLRGLEREGAIVLGPAPSVKQALELLDTAPVNGAVLDVNLGDEKAFPIADVLQARGIPFLFATGYNVGDLPQAYRHVPRCEKPLDVTAVARTLLSFERAA